MGLASVAIPTKRNFLVRVFPSGAARCQMMTTPHKNQPPMLNTDSDETAHPPFLVWVSKLLSTPTWVTKAMICGWSRVFAKRESGARGQMKWVSISGNT
ncbi:hypothetical protein PtrV1_06021 [Pyrenophora tritici-repentis]|nr:hypothetical protein PtrV1_06021 [Pyrenophora tritici-repentis]